MKDEAAKGVIAMVLACAIWGISPIFYKALAHIPAIDVLAHRMVWSLVFFGLVLLVQGRIRQVWDALASRERLPVIALAGLIISFNWVMFIYAVQVGQTTQSSLGYYIYPLVAVLIGRVVFAEVLTRAQMVAVALACCAVCVLTFGLGAAPVLGIALAVSFGFYGLLKKRLDMGPVVSVTAEVVMLTPIAVIILLQSYHNGRAVFGSGVDDLILLILSGPVTALPLILFSYAARRLAMATVGLLQYINPTLQFACAVFLFAEPFGGWHLLTFAMIWTAVAIYSAAALRQDRARRTAAKQASASGTVE
ncbi:MAG: EamA family transporter RarD [Roseobacter sp.]